MVDLIRMKSSQDGKYRIVAINEERGINAIGEFTTLHGSTSSCEDPRVINVRVYFRLDKFLYPHGRIESGR